MGSEGSDSKGSAAERNRRPLFHRTAEALTVLIESMEPGAYLPSEPALANNLGVSRATLREAMQSFEERGLVVRRQGVGTYVTGSPKVIEAGLEVLQSIETLAAQSDIRVEVKDLSIVEKEPTAGERKLFDLGREDRLLEIQRVMYAEGRPAAFLADVLPLSLIPPAALKEGFRGSVLDLLLRRGEPPLHHSRTEIAAVPAAGELAKRLRARPDEVLLCLRGRLYSEWGKLVDLSESYFLPGLIRFHVFRRVSTLP